MLIAAEYRKELQSPGMIQPRFTAGLVGEPHLTRRLFWLPFPQPGLRLGANSTGYAVRHCWLKIVLAARCFLLESFYAIILHQGTNSVSRCNAGAIWYDSWNRGISTGRYIDGLMNGPRWRLPDSGQVLDLFCESEELSL